LTVEVIIITLIFIFFDLLSGYLGAWYEKKLNSSKLRAGFFHKGAFVGFIVLAGLVDKAQELIDIGFAIQILYPVCVYIIVMESTSIFENLCILNSKLKTSKFAQYFEKVGEKHK
jgi:toxin secretion/phage lysis holin